ncbi:hypothetical protein B0T22DRAFT_383718 [Podospora appendiculata]|uniref:Protein kinase domain-containing protein n=1 Tax=Podospora appendiculata TaxID=314037 RepID=A0AAE1C9D8_9PEZI|nr:hypothetical protein B0T22DRAFT_383718 [Podospora appendiculata]
MLGPDTFISTRSWAAHELRHRQQHHNIANNTWTCLFCGPKSRQLDQPGFFRHVSRHLREVALAALPQVFYDVDDSESEDYDSNASVSSNLPRYEPFSVPRKRKFQEVYGDPRVIVCFDRGDRYFIEAHPLVMPPAEPYNIDHLHDPDIVRLTRTRLTTNVVYNFYSRVGQRFIPRDTLQTILSPKTVLEMLNNLTYILPVSEARNRFLRPTGVTSWQNNTSKHFALKGPFSGRSNSELLNLGLGTFLNIQDPPEKHFVKLLSSFEIRNPLDPESIDFYFLFPWADGNLWDFWEQHPADYQRIPHCKWMAKQCYYPARALARYHEERRELLMLPWGSDMLHGCFHANYILWFQSSNILVLAESGVETLKYPQGLTTERMSKKDLKSSATYRAPEFDLQHGTVSRKCDIFSLGCTYLEFITWYLEGWDSVAEAFPNHRLEPDIRGFKSDTFFRIQGAGTARKTATIKPQVNEWIARLKKHRLTSNYILDFLDLIHHALAPNPKERIDGPELFKRLYVLAEACQRDPSYYTEKINLE